MTLTLEELENFSLPNGTLLEEKKLQISLPEKKYEKALVVGRFQPLHRGHIHLLKCALKVANFVAICIGSSEVKNVDNPFSIETRKTVLKRVLKREKMDEFVDNIVDVPDYPDDDFWLKEVLKKVGTFDVVIGNNDWVNGIFEKAGYPIIIIPLLKREVYEGKTIRKQLREEGKL